MNWTWSSSRRGLVAAAMALAVAAGVVRARGDTAPAVAVPAPGSVDGSPSPAKSLFDPTRHMRVSEVRPGMKGYGRTVFSGTNIESFDVEVIDVLKNFNPKFDVILIHCDGAELEHTGAVAGMSGSPIYLYDDEKHQHARMIGAFAYGWPLTKDPIAGVQPIEYMVSIPTASGKDSSNGTAAAGTPSATENVSASKPRWSLDDVPIYPGKKLDPAMLSAHTTRSDAMRDPMRLQPLATPLSVSGMSAKSIDQLAPWFKACGLIPLQGGGTIGGAASSGLGDPDAKLEPGSVLAVPILTGDADLTAIGTVTEVIGDQVFGFGHPFNNEGPIELPMGAGKVSTIIANLQTSFKLGSLTKIRGELTADQSTGVAGVSGKAVPMIPIDIHVVYADGSVDDTYHFQSAVHPRMTAMACGAAVGAAMSGRKELPQYHTLDYDFTIDFADGRTIRASNTGVNGGAAEVFQQLSLPILAAGENPFRRVGMKRISTTVRVGSEAKMATLEAVQVPKLKYQPGETVKSFVTYRPFRAAEAIMPVEFELPRDLPAGTYQLTISDWEKFFNDERQSKPFMFSAESIDELFSVVNEVIGIKHNALYIRLLRQPDGVAVGRTALPRLPSSRREMLLGAGRSDMTAFVSSVVKVVPTDLVMSGSADFSLVIEKNGKVENTAAARPGEKPKAVGPTTRP
jgi:hypothetical protein